MRHLKIIIGMTALLFLSMELSAQFELVPYGDFEGISPQNPEGNECNANVFWFPTDPVSWTEFGNNSGESPQLFSADSPCQGTSFGVPTNSFGTQYPLGGVSSNRNYVGMKSGIARRDGLRIQLRHKLRSGYTYVLRFSAVKMSSGAPELEFRLGSSNIWEAATCPSCSQTFMTIGDDGGPNNDQWHEYSVSFYVSDCDIDWLFIRTQFSTNGRSLLIDNISIEDYCSANHYCRGDFGSLESISCTNYHNAQMPLTFFNLDRIEDFTLSIRPLTAQDPIRTISVHYPNATLSWDGKDDNGNYVANGLYVYTLDMKNSCQCRVMSSQFSKTSDPHTINTFVGFDANYGMLTVYQLSNITELIITIFDSDDQEVWHMDIFNPANAVAWNGKLESGAFAASGQYRYVIQVRNPCEIQEFTGFFPFLQRDPSSQVNPNIDYNSYSKTIVCPYTFSYFSYDYAPTPCCVLTPDWYFSDKHLTGIQDYKLGHNIVAVQNNIVEAGSDIYFQAGNEIILNPEFTVELGAEFEAVILPCTGRMQNPLSGPEDDEEVHEEEVPQVVGSSPTGVFTPNPSDGTFQVELNGITSENLQLYVTDIYGRVVYSSIVLVQSAEKTYFMLDLNALSPGFYSCAIYQNMEQIVVEKLIVQ